MSHHAHHEAKDEAIRRALVRVHMPPLRRAALGAAALGAVLTAMGYAVDPRLGLVGLVLLVGGGVVSVLVDQVTPAQLAAERAWMEGLPFRLDGYFATLAQPGEGECHLQWVVTWGSGESATDHGVVVDRWRAVDPGASSHRGAHDALGVRSGPIVTQGWRQGRRFFFTYSNAKIPVYVHRVVTEVLMPLHARHELKNVSVTRV